jgi:hypothetical protein
MALIKLEPVPTESDDLEDYVAALFLASGHFVEKCMTEYDFTSILELDVVATRYDVDPPVTVVAEAKSGGWGFPDIFKVIGWMTYLRLKSGAFFVSKHDADHDPAACQKKVEPLGLKVIHLGDFSDAFQRFEGAGFPKIIHPGLFSIWRWSFRLERVLIQLLREAKKQDPKKEGPAAALRYHKLVNDGVFFARDPTHRLQLLYDAFRDHPRLSLGVAREIAGGTYDPEEPDPTNPVVGDALFHGAHPILQACFYIEHRARLAILKAAIDRECSTPTGETEVVKDLPDTFEAGVARLRTHRSFKRYALFWQVFMWAFGGFLLDDRTSTEYPWLAEASGIPVEDVPPALTAFDALFPGNDWLIASGPTHCKTVKMTPWPFLGLGAFQRGKRYGMVSTFSELGYGAFGDHTIDDLANFYNHFAATLRRPFEVKDKS